MKVEGEVAGPGGASSRGIDWAGRWVWGYG